MDQSGPLIRYSTCRYPGGCGRAQPSPWVALDTREDTLDPSSPIVPLGIPVASSNPDGTILRRGHSVSCFNSCSLAIWSRNWSGAWNRAGPSTLLLITAAPTNPACGTRPYPVPRGTPWHPHRPPHVLTPPSRRLLHPEGPRELFGLARPRVDPRGSQFLGARSPFAEGGPNFENGLGIAA